MRPLAASILAALALLAATPAAAGDRKIPITTSSEEARAAYLAGREAAEGLRVEEARRHYEEAVARDPRFAAAHLALANASATARGFFESLARAVALAGEVSEGERRQILGQDAGVRGKPEEQREHYAALVAAFPEDERAQVLMGNWHFGRQEYPEAIRHFERAAAIDPSYTLTWNQLGYARRFLGEYAEAEKAFKRYVELIPDGPNPYDSYAELLMKTGRFKESIAQYRKALAKDPRFVASFVGIAQNQVFLGKPAEARATLAKLAKDVARNDGERRQAHLWTVASWVGEGNTARAVEAWKELFRVAEAADDLSNAANDLVLLGQIHLHAGDADRAQTTFEKAVATIERATVPEEVKENVRRNHLYFEALVALARNDLALASTKAEAYGGEAQAKRIPFELRRTHELAGLVALRKKDAGRAVAELERANQRDPLVLLLLSHAHEAKGDAKTARAIRKKATEFNELVFNLAFVRAATRKPPAKVG
jgi:tetratricopeptide (TPR) repeat protein